MSKTKFTSSDTSAELISLGPNHINSCLELDHLALNGFWSKEQWEKELLDTRRICLGLMKASKIIAFACGWTVLNELHLTVVAVHPLHRRKGFGSLILREILQKSQEVGTNCATLEVATNNYAAKALYKRCGFKTAGCRHNYYKNGADALIQWRNLEDQHEHI